MATDDHGLETMRKSGEEITPGDKSDYLIKVKLTSTDADITAFQHDFQLDVAVDKDVTVNHDFTVSLGQIVELHQININSTDVAEFELLIGDGAAVEVFVSKELIDSVGFEPIPFERPIIRAGTIDGLTIRIAKTNLSNQSQDLASKMIVVVR